MSDRDLPPMSSELRSLIEAEAGAPASGPEDVAATRARLLRSIGVAGGARLDHTSASNATDTLAGAGGAGLGGAFKTLAVVTAVAALGGGAYLLARDDARAARDVAPASASSKAEQPPIRSEALTEPTPPPAPDVPISTVTAVEAERTASTPQPRHRPVAPPPEANEAAPPDEESLIAGALAAASAGDFATALDLVEKHGALFPDGAMQQEREILWILALRQLGRQQEAAEREAAFRRRHPASVHQLDRWETFDD